MLLAIMAGCSAAEQAELQPAPWEGAELQRDVNIGVAEGQAELMFGGVTALATSPDGTIYVADSAPLVIRRYSSEGEYLGDLGREGEGPGEYARIAGLAARPDQGVVVWDHGNQRLTAFNDDGTVAWSTRAASTFMLDGLTVDDEGAVHLAASEGQVDDTTRRYFMRRYTSAGEEDGEIDLPTAEPAAPGYMTLDMIRSEVASFETGLLQAWSPRGYLISGQNDGYHVIVDRPDTPLVLQRGIDPSAIGEAERAEIAQQIDWLQARFATMGREIGADPIPATKPYFQAIDVGRDGKIWLRRYAEAVFRADVPDNAPDQPPVRRWLEPTVYDVWEPEGTFLGTLRFPDGVVVRETRGDQIWGTETDATGVQRVVSYRIVPE
ncbi:MAG: hypothetical protein GKS06_11155 [Acidobacteria bacterium]|nr:hypothetical protein [Acidobacteriota bacterium]